MKIAVISPCHRSGLTTITTLLSFCLTWTQQVTTVLSYLGESDAYRYLGTTEVEDKTRSITQLTKLLDAGAIAPENITEYCQQLIRDLYFMDPRDPTLTDEERVNLLKFVFERVPTDFVICEINKDLDEEETINILNVADIIVMVFEPYKNQIDAVRRYTSYSEWPKDKKIMYLCNKYDDIVRPLRDITAALNERHINMCKLHYNPWIMKMAESGQLDTLLPAIIEKDIRVLNLNNDMKEWMSFIQGNNNSRVRWEA